MTRSLAILALLVTALVSGCAGAGGNEGQSATGPTFDDLDLAPTATTGIIRGIVVDDAIRPVAGATVTLQGDPPRVSTSTEAGTFGFDSLAPGPYFLAVSKTGFLTAQASAEVVAGVAEPPVVKVLLSLDAANLPFVETYVFDGFVECTTSAAVLCGAPNLLTGSNITNDRFTWDQYLADGADLVQSEMIWSSTQALSPQLYFEMEALNGGCDADAAFLGSARGDSPIVARINATVVEENEIGSKCPIYYSVFSGGPVCTDPTPVPGVGTLNPICPGVTVQQRFSMYVHAFHGYMPPEEWRFSSGEPVPQPSSS